MMAKDLFSPKKDDKVIVALRVIISMALWPDGQSKARQIRCHGNRGKKIQFYVP